MNNFICVPVVFFILSICFFVFFLIYYIFMLRNISVLNYLLKQIREKQFKVNELNNDIFAKKYRIECLDKDICYNQHRVDELVSRKYFLENNLKKNKKESKKCDSNTNK